MIIRLRTALSGACLVACQFSVWLAQRPEQALAKLLWQADRPMCRWSRSFSRLLAHCEPLHFRCHTVTLLSLWRGRHCGDRTDGPTFCVDVCPSSSSRFCLLLLLPLLLLVSLALCCCCLAYGLPPACWRKAPAAAVWSAVASTAPAGGAALLSLNLSCCCSSSSL